MNTRRCINLLKQGHIWHSCCNWSHFLVNFVESQLSLSLIHLSSTQGKQLQGNAVEHPAPDLNDGANFSNSSRDKILGLVHSLSN